MARKKKNEISSHNIEDSVSNILSEIEALTLENYMMNIANKKMQSDNITMQISNKKLIIENTELKEQIEKMKLDKIRMEMQLLENQKENNRKQVTSITTDYEGYKKRLEEKYMLNGKWGFNPDTLEIIKE